MSKWENNSCFILTFDTKVLAEEALKKIKRITNACSYCTMSDVFMAAERSHLLEGEWYLNRFDYGYGRADLPKKPEKHDDEWNLIFPPPGRIEGLPNGLVRIKRGDK